MEAARRNKDKDNYERVAEKSSACTFGTRYHRVILDVNIYSMATLIGTPHAFIQSANHMRITVYKIIKSS